MGHPVDVVISEQLGWLLNPCISIYILCLSVCLFVCLSVCLFVCNRCSELQKVVSKVFDLHKILKIQEKSTSEHGGVVNEPLYAQNLSILLSGPEQNKVEHNIRFLYLKFNFRTNWNQKTVE